MVNRVRKGSSSVLFSKQFEGCLFVFSSVSSLFFTFQRRLEGLKETAGGKQREKGKECVQLFLRLRPCQL